MKIRFLVMAIGLAQLFFFVPVSAASEMQLMGMKADAAARLASHAPHAGHGESAKK